MRWDEIGGSAGVKRHRGLLTCIVATAILFGALSNVAHAGYYVVSYAANGDCDWDYNYEQTGGSGTFDPNLQPGETQGALGTIDQTGNATSSYAQAAASFGPPLLIPGAATSESSTADLATASTSVTEYDTSYPGFEIGGKAISEINDLLTFNVPGATPATVTNITIEFDTNGHMLPSGTDTTPGQPAGTLQATATFGTPTNIYDINAGVELDESTLLPYVSQDDNYPTGWPAAGSFTVATPESLEFTGTFPLTGINPTLSVDLLQTLEASYGMDSSYLSNIVIGTPVGVTYTSSSGLSGTAPVPEPGTFAILFGAAALGLRRRRESQLTLNFLIESCPAFLAFRYRLDGNRSCKSDKTLANDPANLTLSQRER